MKIETLDRENRRDRRLYLDLPRALAKGDPLWFPGLRSSTAFDLSPRHPFHEHSAAAFFALADRGAFRGRLAVLDNRNYNRHQGRKEAFFTHFECVDDPAAAEALFGAAEAWAQRRGLERLVGPVGLLPTDARGMMVSGQGQHCSMSLPYSPTYYSSLMQHCGFEKLADYLSGELAADFRIPERMESMGRRVMERTGIELRSESSRRRLRRIGRRLLDVYEAGGTAAPLHYPLSEAEKSCILGRMAQSACPGLVHWLERDGAVCGFHLAEPNYAEALRRAGNGRLARMAACLRQRARPREITVSMIYLAPEYQGRGLSLVLFAACQQAALRLGCRRGLVGPVHEQNRASLSVLEKSGIEFTMRHRLYQRRIG